MESPFHYYKENIKNLWTDRSDLSFFFKIKESYDFSNEYLKDYFRDKEKVTSKTKKELQSFQESNGLMKNITDQLLMPGKMIAHSYSWMAKTFHHMTSSELVETDIEIPSRSEVIATLRKNGMAKTSIYSELVAMDEQKAKEGIGVILLAPTDHTLYDQFRKDGLQGFDEAYVEALKAKMTKESGVKHFITIHNPTHTEYQGAIMASPFVRSIATVGHGDESSISVQYDDAPYSKLVFPTEQAKKEYKEKFAPSYWGEVYESYLQKMSKHLPGIPYWKPVQHIFKETCGDEDGTDNFFGKSIADTIHYYNGVSNPIQHMVGVGQKTMKGASKNQDA